MSKKNSIFLFMIVLIQTILSLVVVSKLNRIEQVLLPSTVSESDKRYDVSIDGEPSKGSTTPVVTIIEFSDYQCPFCANAEDDIAQILKTYEGKVRFIYRDFPLQEIHPEAFKASEVANCAGEQNKFWEMHDLLFQNQARLGKVEWNYFAQQLNLDLNTFESCLTSGKFTAAINKDLEDGKKHMVDSTPTFFVNGRKITGVQSLEDIVKIELDK